MSAVTFVAQTATTATSVTLPAFKQGDVIVVCAVANTAVAPTLATGFTNGFSQAANGIGFRVGYLFAKGSETSGTWTNATFLMVSIYRGVANVGGAGSGTNVASTTVTLPGVGTLTNTLATSWFVTFGACLTTTSMTTPASTTLRGTTFASTGSMGLVCDSNAVAASWGQHTSTAGASVTGGGGSLELIPSSGMFQNYQQISVGDGMSVSEKIR